MRRTAGRQLESVTSVFFEDLMLAIDTTQCNYLNLIRDGEKCICIQCYAINGDREWGSPFEVSCRGQEREILPTASSIVNQACPQETQGAAQHHQFSRQGGPTTVMNKQLRSL